MKKAVGWALLLSGWAGCSPAGVTSAFEVTEAAMCRGMDENRIPQGISSTFSPATAKVICWFSWKNAKPNSQLRAAWYYVPENRLILDFPMTLARASDSGTVSLQMPAGKTLPSGAYRLDLKAEGTVARSIPFTVSAASSSAGPGEP